MLEHKSDGYVIAIIGATGLVGRNMMDALLDHQIPIKTLRVFASPKSVGKTVLHMGREIIMESLDDASFEGIDVALFAAGSSVSLRYANAFVQAGALVIDNSSAYRKDLKIPLIVPEVNPEDLTLSGIIANPNCSTIQSVLPIKALDQVFGVRMVSYVTYQSVSGSGQKGIDAMHHQEGISVYKHDINRSVIPEIDLFLEDGYTKEEHKMIDETRRLLNIKDLPVSATCVRVPIERGHAVQMTVSLKTPFELSRVKDVLSAMPGIVLKDDPENRLYPVTEETIGTDLVHVGRIRRDLADPMRLLLFVVADNIRKGAAGNAVQILKLAIERTTI